MKIKTTIVLEGKIEDTLDQVLLAGAFKEASVIKAAEEETLKEIEEEYCGGMSDVTGHCHFELITD